MKYLVILFINLLLWAPELGAQTRVQGFGDDLHSEKAFLGVRSDEISKEKAQKLGFNNLYGSYVSSVIKNTAADRAGIQPFDYIYGIEKLECSPSRNLTDLLSVYRPGDKAEILLVRNQREQHLSITFGTREEAVYENVSPEKKAFLGISQVYSRSEADQEGVIVHITANSSAETLGLENNDRITSINDHPIIDWNDITTAIGNMQAGDKITVGYVRNGRAAKASGTIQGRSSAVYAPTTPSSDKAFLGINSEGLSKKKAQKLGIDNPYGSYVTKVIHNTAAHKAGIQPLDYIYGVDEYRVGDNQSLGGILRKYQPGDRAEVLLVRQGQIKSIPIVLSQRSDATYPETTKCEDPFFGVIQSYKSSPDKTDGILVNIVKESTAEALGLQNGDIIKKINGYTMVDWTDLGCAVDMLRPGEKIKVDYERNGSLRSGVSTIKSYSETKKCSNCDCDDEKLDIEIVIPEGLDFNFNWEDYEERATNDLSNIGIQLTAPSSTELNNLGLNRSDYLSVQDLHLHLNELEGKFILKFNLPSKGETRVRIFNEQQRAIYDYDLGRFSGSFNDPIDLASKNATYILSIEQDQRLFTKKIVVNNN